jgi:hypothetical protein
MSGNYVIVMIFSLFECLICWWRQHFYPLWRPSIPNFFWCMSNVEVSRISHVFKFFQSCIGAGDISQSTLCKSFTIVFFFLWTKCIHIAFWILTRKMEGFTSGDTWSLIHVRMLTTFNTYDDTYNQGNESEKYTIYNCGMINCRYRTEWLVAEARIAMWSQNWLRSSCKSRKIAKYKGHTKQRGAGTFVVALWKWSSSHRMHSWVQKGIVRSTQRATWLRNDHAWYLISVDLLY